MIVIREYEDGTEFTATHALGAVLVGIGLGAGYVLTKEALTNAYYRRKTRKRQEKNQNK